MSATATLAPPQPVYTNEPIFRFTVDRYHELIRSGNLTSDDPVELLEGLLVYKMSKNPAHSSAAALVEDWIRSILEPGYRGRFQEPITLKDGEPEPDAAIVRGTIQTFQTRHPGPDEVILLVEIAESTLDRDRGIKVRSYARAGIEPYWIINLVDRQIEIYTNPDPTAAEPAYLDRKIFKSGQTVLLNLNKQKAVEVSVASLLPSV